MHGAGRGKSLKVPTLNMEVNALQAPYGVYAARASLEQKKYSAVLHWGPRPTFKDPTPVMEVHLLNFDGEIYGETVEVELGPFLRKIRSFDQREDLMRQIQKDIQMAKHHCAVPQKSQVFLWVVTRKERVQYAAYSPCADLLSFTARWKRTWKTFLLSMRYRLPKNEIEIASYTTLAGFWDRAHIEAPSVPWVLL